MTTVLHSALKSFGFGSMQILCLFVCREHGMGVDSWLLVGFPFLGSLSFHLRPQPNSPDLSSARQSTGPSLLTLPILRPAFVVILRMGWGVYCRQGVEGRLWVPVGGEGWHSQFCVQGTCRLPSSGGPSLGCLLCQREGGKGVAPTSQCPCLKGTRMPHIRECWVACGS